MKFMKTTFIRALLALTLVTSIGLQANRVAQIKNDNFCSVKTSVKPVGYCCRFEPRTKKLINTEAEKVRQATRDDLNCHAACGVVGERISRQFFEKKGVYMSFATYMQNNGCFCDKDAAAKLTQYDGQRGIDNLYLPVLRDHRGNIVGINPRLPAIIVEAKYNRSADTTKSKLHLKKTKYLCQQMSRQWIRGNLQRLVDRLSTLSGECAKQALAQIKRIQADFDHTIKFDSSRVLRAATVLSSSGSIYAYLIHDKYKQPHEEKTVETATRLLQSILPEDMEAHA